MKRRLINHFLFGLPLGVTYGLLVTLGYSYAWGAHVYSPSTPVFVSASSNSLNVLSFSILIWALMGALFAVAVLIFEMDHWSLARQTLTHFCVTLVGFMALAYLAGWYPLNLTSLSSEVLVFVVIYLVFWFSSMLRTRRNVAAINRKIKKNR